MCEYVCYRSYSPLPMLRCSQSVVYGSIEYFTANKVKYKKKKENHVHIIENIP